MRSLVKSFLVASLLFAPALAVRGSDASHSIRAGVEAGDASAPQALVAPVKFAQQLTAGTAPDWQRLAPGYGDQSPLPVRGQSMYYNPGVMQKVLNYRYSIRQIVDCPDCIGYVALLRSGDIGRKVWLQVNDTTVEGPFYVADVAAKHDIPRLLRIGWGIDVDWETAKRWGLRMPMVTIWDSPPLGMIVNSTAAYRDSLKSIATQFNEVPSWKEAVAVSGAVQPVNAPKDGGVMNGLAQQVQAKPATVAGTVTGQQTIPHNAKQVQGILFKPGPIEVRIEKIQ